MTSALSQSTDIVPQKNIFLLVSGLSPQIVTETLYAFYVNRALSQDIPAEVHLITTEEGANNARLQLLAPNTRFFAKLLEEYGIRNVQFNESFIHVIEDESGQKLKDIRTPEQNSAAANFISQHVKSLTQNNEYAVHVSLAGGRKTMGYYVGYALSLFGRPQDTLSHVLVSEDFENNRDFFFPTKHSHIIYSREQEPLDTREAKVELAEIPFVRLRGELPPEFLDGPRSFNDTVRMINSAHEQPELCFDIKNRIVSCNGYAVKLELVNFCFFLWFAHKKIEQQMPMKSPNKTIDAIYQGDDKDEVNIGYANEFLSVMELYDLVDDLKGRTEDLLESGIGRQMLTQKISALSKPFKSKLTKSLVEKFMPKTVKKNGQSFIDLTIPKEAIKILR